MTSPQKSRTLIPTLSAVALLMTAPLLVPASAHAGELPNTMRVTFVYKKSDAPERIYTALESTARRACVRGSSALSHRKTIRTCMADVMDAVMMKMRRPGVAALHQVKRA